MNVLRPTILIVEDELPLRKALQDMLANREGYNVVAASTLREARGLLDGHDIQLILLDLMLPDGSGHALLREVRGRGLKMPVMVLTASTKLDDMEHGIEVGADDYLQKPCKLEEVLARVGARLRRAQAQTPAPAAAPAAAPVLGFAGFRIDEQAYRVLAPGDQLVDLSPAEFRLLCLLVRRRPQVVKREEIQMAVWPGETIEDATVSNTVYSLRKALMTKCQSGYRIKTLRKLGYRLDVDNS